MQPSNPMNVSYQQQMATGIPVGSIAAGNHHQKPGLHLAWSSGLCDCFSDVPSCCLTFWCPCITFGRIAEIVDQGSTSCGTSGALYGLLSLLTGCGCIYSCVYRTKMRRTYNIEENPCGDCCVHFCCEACALCQEYRHLQAQGFDMPLGWHGNMAMQNRGVEMAAPTAPMMGRGMK